MPAKKRSSKRLRAIELLGIWNAPRFRGGGSPKQGADSVASVPAVAESSSSPTAIQSSSSPPATRPASQSPAAIRPPSDPAVTELPSQPALTSHRQQVGHAVNQPAPIQDVVFEDPDQDWVRLRKPWSPVGRAILVALIIVAILSSVALVVNRWINNQIDPPGLPGEAVLVEIPFGASTNDIAIILSDEGVVANSTFARLQWRGDGPFEAGEYVFAKNMSLSEAEAVLVAGPIITPGMPITIPEGLWLADIRSRMLDALPEFNPTELSTALFGNVVRSDFQPTEISSLEGLLFPDTYQVGEEELDNEVDLVRRMIEQMDATLVGLGYEQALERTGYTPYEVLIIASMIEEEAKVREDRAKIARVIYNRLELDIPLGIDATVLFALGRHTAELTVQDLAIDSPYNTRIYRGLPPTPIAAPGRAALEAALNPVEGDWIFYVLADTDGSHFFTDSEQEFLDQVQKSRDEGIF